MQTPSSPVQPGAEPLYHITPAAVDLCGQQIQAIAMQRYQQAHMPAVVGIAGLPTAHRLYALAVLEPHVARELAANLIACAEIAERHNLDTASREARCQERIALADAISVGTVGAASC